MDSSTPDRFSIRKRYRFWRARRLETLEDLRNLLVFIEHSGSLIQPNLNLNITDSMRRTFRYFPHFQEGRGRRLRTNDREPFPSEIQNVGVVSPYWQVPWLKNYYESNPIALYQAVSKPRNLQKYLNKNLSSSHAQSINSWIDSRIHTVKSRENLSSIARKHNVSLIDLKKRNPWLANRSGRKLSGFDYLRSGDKIMLPPRWDIPRGQTEPFPNRITQIPLINRQPWIRDYYRANPEAAITARKQMRMITNWAHKHIR